MPDGTVPICPLRRTWSEPGGSCSRLQIPLKLAWAVTIHKSQGLTLEKVVINIGKKEFSTGLTFVAWSRVRRLKDLLFDPPFSFQRVANLANSQHLQERLLEDARLLGLESNTLPDLAPTNSPSSYINSNDPSSPSTPDLPYIDDIASSPSTPDFPYIDNDPSSPDLPML